MAPRLRSGQTREQRWILLRGDGSVAEQIVMPDATPPSMAGHNPEGLLEQKVRRHGDLQHEHWDQAKGRWVSDKARKQRAERRSAYREMKREDLVEMLLGKIETLEARLAAVEAKVGE